ncbi:MAG TPA: ABC transporter ATP-binding protein, partial [Ktedonobacterales bacterium]|nr:ABC transporter ATP-binding protein [Ktedonobacterales bacterium]
MFRLFRFLRPYIGLILLVFVLVFLQSMANLYLPTLLADIVNNGIVKNDQGYIVREGGIMLLITFGGALAAIGSAYF